MLQFWIALTALLVLRSSLASAEVIKKNVACPSITLNSKLNLNSFKGLWYETGYANRDLPYKEGCVMLNFTVSGNSLNVNIEQDAVLVAKLALNPKEGAESSFAAELTHPVTSGETTKLDYYIMSTDYSCYAVVYTCKDGKKDHISSAYLITRDRDAQCYVLKVRHEESIVPDMEIEEFQRNNNDDCQFRKWKPTDD